MINLDNKLNMNQIYKNLVFFNSMCQKIILYKFYTIMDYEMFCKIIQKLQNIYHEKKINQVNDNLYESIPSKDSIIIDNRGDINDIMVNLIRGIKTLKNVDIAYDNNKIILTGTLCKQRGGNNTDKIIELIMNDINNIKINNNNEKVEYFRKNLIESIIFRILEKKNSKDKRYKKYRDEFIDNKIYHLKNNISFVLTEMIKYDTDYTDNISAPSESLIYIFNKRLNLRDPFNDDALYFVKGAYTDTMETSTMYLFVYIICSTFQRFVKDTKINVEFIEHVKYLNEIYGNKNDAIDLYKKLNETTNSKESKIYIVLYMDHWFIIAFIPNPKTNKIEMISFNSKTQNYTNYLNGFFNTNNTSNILNLSSDQGNATNYCGQYVILNLIICMALIINKSIFNFDNFKIIQDKIINFTKFNSTSDLDRNIHMKIKMILYNIFESYCIDKIELCKLFFGLIHPQSLMKKNKMYLDLSNLLETKIMFDTFIDDELYYKKVDLMFGDTKYELFIKDGGPILENNEKHYIKINKTNGILVVDYLTDPQFIGNNFTLLTSFDIKIKVNKLYLFAPLFIYVDNDLYLNHIGINKKKFLIIDEESKSNSFEKQYINSLTINEGEDIIITKKYNGINPNKTVKKIRLEPGESIIVS